MKNNVAVYMMDKLPKYHIFFTFMTQMGKLS